MRDKKQFSPKSSTGRSAAGWRGRARHRFLLDLLEPRTLLTTLVHASMTYNIGPFDNLQLANLDGQPGNEIPALPPMPIRPSPWSTMPHGTVTAFAPPAWSSMNIANLDGLPGQDIYTVSGSNVTVINPNTATMTTYTMGTFTSLQLADLDGQPGEELIAFNGNIATVLNARLGHGAFLYLSRRHHAGCR